MPVQQPLPTLHGEPYTPPCHLLEGVACLARLLLLNHLLELLAQRLGVVAAKAGKGSMGLMWSICQGCMQQPTLAHMVCAPGSCAAPCAAK